MSGSDVCLPVRYKFQLYVKFTVVAVCCRRGLSLLATMTEGSQAFVTLATDDSYGMGALVLANSLRQVQTVNKIVALISSNVAQSLRSRMSEVFDDVIEVNVMNSNDEVNLSLMARPELGVTFTKLHCWKLTQFTKCVFLDADTLVLDNCDELFEKEELSAASDIGWPDCFNSGVFVFKPSVETYDDLIKLALQEGSFDGGDQGLLNTYFSNWATKDISKHLSFIYNMTTTSSYAFYSAAHKRYGKNTKIVHFLGPYKPWMHTCNKDTGCVDPCVDSPHSELYLQKWWDIFNQHVCYESKETESDECTSSSVTSAAESPQKSPVKEIQSPVPESQLSEMRKNAWEQGQIDYMGLDSFENIRRKLDEVINIVEQSN